MASTENDQITLIKDHPDFPFNSDDNPQAQTGLTKADQQLSINEKLARLEIITQKLENKETQLEESLQLYQEGMALVSACNKELEEARAIVTKLAPAGDEEVF